MLSLDKLAALDLLVWLRNTERAAELAFTDQSTISRRSRAALEQFRLRIRRGGGDWQLEGDTELLGLERQVHQRARFLGRQPLRLQVPYWTQRAALRRLPEAWSANPPSGARACEDPVTLLRDRVIDACLVTPTQIPDSADDLLVLDLYRRPIELTLFSGEPCREAINAFERQRQEGCLDLRLMPFLPRSCCLRSREWFEALVMGGANERSGSNQLLLEDRPAVSVAFLTPEMRTAQDHPWLVHEALESHPYVERLVVLAANAHEPAVQELQEQVLKIFEPLNRPD